MSGGCAPVRAESPALIECYIRRVTVCAEAIAMAAVTDGDGAEIENIGPSTKRQRRPERRWSRLRHGREMISDYAPTASVIRQARRDQRSDVRTCCSEVCAPGIRRCWVGGRDK